MHISLSHMYSSGQKEQLGKSDNYRQANPGDPPADKDTLKAEIPKTIAKS